MAHPSTTHRASVAGIGGAVLGGGCYAVGVQLALRRSASVTLVPLVCVWLAALAGCGGTESRLNPAEPLEGLPAASVSQLCRYTVDVLEGQDVSCLADAASLGSFAACEGEPPWDGYETVLDWEECVNARLADPCLVEAPCLP